jgi:hypothetical protein
MCDLSESLAIAECSQVDRLSFVLTGSQFVFVCLCVVGGMGVKWGL